MARLERRLRKLEARLTDRSGLVPYTELWFDYWAARLDKAINGEEVDEKIPLEFLQAVLARAEAGDATVRPQCVSLDDPAVSS
jgi:hypothetical protein